MHMPEKILVVRNDKLGDFMLAWPSFALLRQALPNTLIYALVSDYTRPIAERCDSLDGIVIDPGRGSGWSEYKQLTASIRQQHFDAVITLFSTGRIAAALVAARIPYRLAPATKLAQFLYNHRELQRRSRSEKPEWLYNVDLVRRALHDWQVDCPPTPEPPYLAFDDLEIQALRESFYKEHRIPGSHRLIFIHPGSGGSANNLQPEQFANLASRLQSEIPLTFIVSAGPQEMEIADNLAELLAQRRLSARTYISREGLAEYARHLRLAYVFISGSTGPLHIAGALNLRTVGFYPRKRSSTPLRWQTLSEASKRLAFAPPEPAHETEMLGIDIENAAAKINALFLSTAYRDAT